MRFFQLTLKPPDGAAFYFQLQSLSDKNEKGNIHKEISTYNHRYHGHYVLITCGNGQYPVTGIYYEVEPVELDGIAFFETGKFFMQLYVSNPGINSRVNSPKL